MPRPDPEVDVHGVSQLFTATTAEDCSATVAPAGTSLASRLWPRILVTRDGSDMALVDESCEKFRISGTIHLPKGAFRIRITNIEEKYIGNVQGGLGYALLWKCG